MHKEWGILKIIRFRPRWEIRVLILKTPRSESITLSKAQAEFFFLFFLIIGWYPAGFTGKNDQKKENRPGAMKGKMPTAWGIKWVVMGLFDWPVMEKKIWNSGKSPNVELNNYFIFWNPLWKYIYENLVLNIGSFFGMFFGIWNSRMRPFTAFSFVTCFFLLKLRRDNRVIRKVRKTQHQNPEFGHTQGEIKIKGAKKYFSIQGGMKLRKRST